jgi:hypothetical protein
MRTATAPVSARPLAALLDCRTYRSVDDVATYVFDWWSTMPVVGASVTELTLWPVDVK